MRTGLRVKHDFETRRKAVGELFENVLGRDFAADAPWEKLGTDVTEFKVAVGKAYWAPALDGLAMEIVASDISEPPNLAQQERMLDELLPKVSEGSSPVM